MNAEIQLGAQTKVDPKDKPPQALTEKIERGELGVKSGHGFYTYPNPEFAQPEFLDSTK